MSYGVKRFNLVLGIGLRKEKTFSFRLHKYCNLIAQNALGITCEPDKSNTTLNNILCSLASQ